MLDKRDKEQVSKWFHLQLILKDRVSLTKSGKPHCDSSYNE